MDECVLWKGSKLPTGYGFFRRNGKRIYAHRDAYEKVFGKIPDGVFVCHKCDNPSCIKSEHLFLGTPKENSRDIVSKDRHSYGGRNGMARLAEQDIIEIRKLYAAGKNQQEIAKLFKASRCYISEVVHGKKWSHLGGPIVNEPYKGKRHKLRKIDEDQILLIRQNRLQEESLKCIASKYGISCQRVSQLCKN
ncbi:MAG: HNH endonuclease [Chroococcidiopsidaceae cyanobacterium CP_BM_RX_35]|nr:HNH endonuclease [Chroococcidiopsidaceae cyanobacterium CP_BM_RX_35]